MMRDIKKSLSVNSIHRQGKLGEGQKMERARHRGGHIIDITIDVPFHVESQGTVTLDVKNPPGLSPENVPLQVIPSPMGETFLNSY